MPQHQALLVFLHVLANLVWIGSIVSVAVVLKAVPSEPRISAELALKLYRRVANPAFAVSFTLGLLQLLMNLEYYLKTTHFMHGKLTLALAVIALHHVLGARARKVASGARADAGPLAGLTWALLACAAGATYFVVLKPF